MPGIQTSNGKAFEYACAESLYRALSVSQTVVIDDSKQLQTAKSFYENISLDLKQSAISASDAATRVISRLEPQLLYPGDSMPLHISLQTDAAGQKGDVRDVLCLRNQNCWEIGISCKHNHHAVKHSRLSGRIDFGKEWFNISCSNRYFSEVNRVFDDLKEKRDAAKATGRPALWSDIENKAEKYYRPVLDAFKDEFNRLEKQNPQIVPERLIRYLVGRNDFYKVIADDKRCFTRIEAVNINGTLSQPAGEHAPMIKVPALKLPTKVYDIDYKDGSDNTIHIVCNEGWEISMRIHSASSKIEPSLKFDVNLISLPSTIYAQVEPW